MSLPPGELVKVAQALTKPLVKLLDVAQNGAGAIYEPLRTRLNGSAEARALATKTHAQGQARLVRAEYDHQLKMLKIKQGLELEAAQGSGRPAIRQLVPRHREGD